MQAYYEQAIHAFQKATAQTSPLEKTLFGDANKRRIDFVKERLVDISWGRLPDGDKYLDENGRKRAVPSYPPPQLEGGFRNDGWRAERDAEGWRSDAEAWRSEPSDAEGWREHEHGAGFEAPSGDDAQERARREWLQYYLEVGDFKKASELVVSRAERDDLAYLMERASRQGGGGSAGGDHESPIL